MAQIQAGNKSLFVILPDGNAWNMNSSVDSHAFLGSASRAFRASPRSTVSLSAVRPGLDIALLDEVAPSETVLVAMDDEQRARLLQSEPGLRMAPVQELEPLWLQRFRLAPSLGALASGPRRILEVQAVDAKSGAALSGADIVALSDRANRIGAIDKTDSKGLARLIFSAATDRLESVEAFVPSGYWPAYAQQVELSGGPLTLACMPIDLVAQDVRAHFGLQGADDDGLGVKVAVVDSGVSKHRNLRIAKGRNVVKGERASAFGDLLGHGTHVAGVIAGRGQAGSGVRGVVPAVDLHAYRVFGKGQEKALSFNIAKGIRQAVDDGCDLINVSLGGDADVPDVLREVQRARTLGAVCLAATGNDYRGPVNYPARYSAVLGVAACGRRGTWPDKAAQDLEAVKPFGKDRKNFVASFSNVGSEVRLIGPGVGVLSTYPGGYAVMDGTSMACPTATGALARILARNRKVLGMERNQKRSDAIVKLALDAAGRLGFGAKFEGAGLLL